MDENENSGSIALCGAYSLISLKSDSDNGDQIQPFGEDPLGTLIYSSNGKMSANIVSKYRESYLVDNAKADNEGDCNEIFSNQYIGYAGSYKVDSFIDKSSLKIKGVIYHSVEVSLYLGWIGTVFKRPFSLEGDFLTIASPEPRVGPGGCLYTSRLIWRRCGADHSYAG